MSDGRTHTTQRKLGENDPGRYEVRILIGPCTLAEAENYLDEVSDNNQLGASFSLTTFDEDEEAEGGN